MPKIYAYIRVSSDDQNLDRQLDAMESLGINPKKIYSDEQSGKNFDRTEYRYMKKALEPGDTVVIKSLDRLGRNQKEVKKEWEYFVENQINIRVLDMPVLNREYKTGNKTDESINELIRNLFFEVITWTDQEHRRRIKESQREGIVAAKKRGKHLGRPKLNLSTLTKEQKETLNEQYENWKAGRITGVKFAKLMDLKKNSFYKVIKEYEESLAIK